MKRKAIVIFTLIFGFADCLSQETTNIVVAVNQPADCKALGFNIQKSIIYPNPASSFLQLPIEVSSYYLIDASGKKYHPEHNNELNRIDTSGLSEGIYFLHLITVKGTNVWKLKIQRR